MSETRLRRGEVLFHEGDSGDKLYIVLDGKVKLGRTSSDGRENLLAILGPGSMFGELSLFDPGPRSATVTAVTDAEFVSLSHEDLLRWLEGRPAVARGLLTQLAGRLRKANDVVADLVFSDVPGRVAKALLDLAERFGRTADDGVHVHHDLTQEELAQLVGASRETVNKALADFASRGWLRLEPRSVVIMDMERMTRRGSLRIPATPRLPAPCESRVKGGRCGFDGSSGVRRLRARPHAGPGPDGVPPHRGRRPRGGPRADRTLQGSPRVAPDRGRPEPYVRRILYNQNVACGGGASCARPPCGRTTTPARRRGQRSPAQPGGGARPADRASADGAGVRFFEDLTEVQTTRAGHRCRTVKSTTREALARVRVAAAPEDCWRWADWRAG